MMIDVKKALLPSVNLSSKNTSATAAEKTAKITKLIIWICILY